MRVCLLARKIVEEPETGFGRYSLSIYRGLVERNIEVELLSQGSNIKPFHTILSPIYYDVLAPPLKLLARKIKRLRIDVYHAIDPTQGLYFPLIPKRNTVVFFHDMSGISSLWDTDARLLDNLWRIYDRVATFLSLRYAGHVIVNSEQTKGELVSKLKVPEEKVTVIPLGCSEMFQPLKRGQREIPTVGYLADLVPRKRVDYLIRAFHILRQRHPDFRCRLEICGTGSEYEKLSKLASQLNLKPDVVFKGVIPDEEIVETYNNFDLFAFPSSYEGFGNIILEAQKCGLPVLTTEDGKIPEETKRFTVQCSSEGDMAEKIYALLTNQSLYQEVSQKGQDYSKQFTWDRCVEKTIEVYEKVRSR